MDDYISKPVYLEELRMALQRAGERQRTSLVEARADMPSLDRGVVAQLLARPRGRELLALYAEESHDIMTRLRAAVIGQDAGAIREAAHSLKGSSQYVGATHVATLSTALEQQSRAGMLAGTEALLAELDAAFACVCRAIAALDGMSDEEHTAR